MIRFCYLQNWLTHVPSNINVLHLILLPVFYHIFGTKNKVCKDNCWDHQLKLIFAKKIKHIHRLEGFKKLANMILGTFKGMICI